MVEEIIKLKAEIFDLIQSQEQHIVTINTIQQTKLAKMKDLKEQEQKGPSPSDEIIKLKAELFDLMQEQDRYVQIANDIQQSKLQKLNLLKEIEQQTRAVAQINP